MKIINAKIICDSINESGNRLTTFVCRFNRFLLPELNTHRALSRNSASSRAIPVSKMIERVENDLAVPVSWGANQKGMQAGKDVDEGTAQLARHQWETSSKYAITFCKTLAELGIHKQIANRVLEPYFYIEAIISATEWGNFFNLRCHKDAQPEFRELAFCMLQAYVDSVPVLKKAGEWHIPFGDKYLDEQLSLEKRIKIGVARCARVSYLNFEGRIDHQKDYELHDSLLNSGHCSPFEHVAKSLREQECYIDDKWGNVFERPSGNFFGWLQYRKTLTNENRKTFDPIALLATH